MQIWDEQFKRDYDFPRSKAVSTKYIICSTPRCGSHFLGHLLYRAGTFGYPLEYFHPSNLPHWLARARQENEDKDLLTFLQKIRTSPNGCFGIKAHFTHLKFLERYISLNILACNYKFIFIRRKDLARQAISYSKALQTGVWISELESNNKAHYIKNSIKKCLNNINWQNACWLSFLNALGINFLDLQYESLREQPDKALQSIAYFLNVEFSKDVDLTCLRTKVQGTQENEVWKRKFTREMHKIEISAKDFTIEPSPGEALAKRKNQRIKRLKQIFSRRNSPK